jgi:hypothetical protein
VNKGSFHELRYKIRCQDGLIYLINILVLTLHIIFLTDELVKIHDPMLLIFKPQNESTKNISYTHGTKCGYPNYTIIVLATTVD